MILYEAAEERYYKDLDIVNIMSVVRLSMNFLKNYMKRDERMLLKFNASNVIVADIDSEEGGAC